MRSGAEEFERLYPAEHAALVGYFLRRVDDPDLARDLTAEAFRIAWAGWAETGPRDRASGSRGTWSSTSTGDGNAIVDGPSDATSDEQAEDVRAVLSTLRPAEQEVLMLTYWDGLSAREIAPVLGITRSAVRVRLHRARQAFATAWAAEPLPASTP